MAIDWNRLKPDNNMGNIAMRAAGIFLSLSALALVPAFPALAAPDDDAPVRYVVRRGDTLIKLGDRYLERASTYKIIQQQNSIANAQAIPVGTILKIPRSLLKYQRAKARLVAVRGRVIAGKTQASVGQILGEGTALSTANSSFATLLLDDGSRVSLPSNTQIRIRRLRSYVLGGSLDYDFDVTKGGMQSAVVKHKSTDDRYQVRTPKAVSAVRGTNFQSRFDDVTNKDFAEVVEGALSVDAGSKGPAELPAGNGLALIPGGEIIREALLAPPALIEPGKLQADPIIRFAASQTAAVAGYRITLAADAGFIDQVADRVTGNEPAEFDDIGNGNYFVRARAISPNGIEGLPATFAFKRRLNGVKASAGQTDEGYVFKWLGDGEGVRRHHFQLFSGSVDSLPIIDEASLGGDRVSISDLPAGDYFWRVGVVQYLDGEMATNWIPVEKLSVAPT
jgi:hypothetical protein